MIPYILHSAVLLSGCFIFYKLLLEKETYFRLNRSILLLCMGIAVLLPLWVIPAHWSYSHQFQALNSIEDQLIVLADQEDRFKKEFPISSQAPSGQPGATERGTTSSPTPLEGKNAQSLESRLLVGSETIPTSPKASLSDLVPSIEPEVDKAFSLPAARPFSWKELLGFIYLTGIFIFSLSLLMQFLSLAAILWRAPKMREGKYILVEIPAQNSPFSFGPFICLNTDLVDKRQVLAHEKIHVDQKHSLDILLIEFLLIFQWFNPFAWQYRKAVKQNLEYLTDEKMLTKGFDPYTYQESLVRVSAPNHTLAITANYNHSLLKKRILMMQAKRSSLQSAWKYLALFSLLGLSTSFLNAVHLPILGAEEPIAQSVASPDPDPVLAPDATEEPMPIEELAATQTHFSGLEEPKQRIQFVMSLSLAGTWKGRIREEEFCISLQQSEEERNYYTYNECYSLNKFPSIQALGNAKVDIHEFSLEKEEGRILFEGSFDGGRGNGGWIFESSATFREKLTSMGLAGVGDKFLFRLFLSDDNDKYIENAKELQKLGLSDVLLEDFMTYLAPARLVKEYQAAGLDLNETKDFVYSRVDSEDLLAYREAGLSWQLHEEFIHARVPAEFLKEYMISGLDLEEHEDFIHARVPPDFLKRYMDEGLDLVDNEEYIHSRVPPEFLKEYMASGLDLEDHEDFIHARVPSEFLKEYIDAGLDLEKHEDYVHARVPPEFLKEYMDAGLDLEKHEEYIHSRVPSEFLKEYMASGLDLEKHEDFIHARVPSEFLKEYIDAGLDLEKHEDYVHARVPPELLTEYMDAGLDLEKHEEYIHGRVSPEFLSKYMDAGIDIDKYEDYIHGRVPAELLKEYMSSGLDLDKHEDYIHSRVSPDFLKTYLDAGLDLDKHEEFIHGRVSPSLLKKYLDAGLDLDKYEEFIHSRVSADFIQEYIDAGLDPFKYEEYIHRRMNAEEILKIRRN
ncbi:MAG: M56 family metallopeptidase [Bacteroidota bacterium]